MADRQEALGFIPQKESVYNKLLPYGADIDLESQNELAEIKSNLGRSVQLRDLKFGSGHWVGQLSRYIRLYGLKFSKEDHLHFIKLLFELTIIPDLEVSLVQKFANQLVHLLKKKELLTREDLEIPWRPLYNLVNSIMYSHDEPNNLILFPGNIENTLKNLVKCCRTYFAVDCTKEMLEEWRPLLCPFDITMVEGLRYIDLFIPVSLPPEQMDQGFRLWFKEIMDMWSSFQTNPTWESHLVSLMARVAYHNIGYIDWSPYIPRVFNKLLRIFNLPVGTQSIQVGRHNNRVDIEPYITWIVAMMGGGSEVQDYVDKLFKTLHTFYHPSNLGKWNITLSSLLMTFPRVFINRLKRERYEKPKWFSQVLDSHKLTDNDVTRFVESMKDTVFLSMFSKYGSQDSAVALRHLSNMRPELIVPPLLEKMYPAMETLIEPHRLIACMNCIVSVVRPMLSAGKWYPEGKLHILPLLNLALPGIDSNDFKKCLVTFQMISTFVSLIAIVDCSDANHIRNDLTEVERELCSATAQFEDFVLQFTDRIINLIEKSAQDHVHGAQDRLNPEQTMVEIGLASTFTSVLQQCSAPIYTSALHRLHNFIISSVFESKVGGRFAANLVRAAVKAKPAEALKMFMDRILDDLLHHIKSHEDVLTSENLDDGFLWNMLMFAQLVRCDGNKLLPYKEKLLEIFPTILRLQCVQGYEIAGQTIRYVLRALTLLYPTNFKSIPGSFDRPISEYLAIRDWAVPGDINNLGVEWHIPSAEEIEFTQQLLNKILLPELETIKAINSENPMQREELLRRLNTIMECLNGAGAVLPMWEGKSISFVESEVPLTRFNCSKGCGTDAEVTILDGKNVRATVTEAMRPLLYHMLACCEDDTKGFFKLLKIYETVLFFTGTPKNDFDNRWKSFHAVKKALEDKMREGKRHIRALLVDRVFLQHEMRCLQKNKRVFTEKHKEMLEDLFALSISRYSEVRKRAQSVLFQNFHNYPYSYRGVLNQLVSRLKNKEIPEHEFQGCLYVLQGSNKRTIPTKRSWEVISQVWPAIVQAQHSEKPTILNTIEHIVSNVIKNVETTAIKIEVNKASLEAAGKLLASGSPSPKQPGCTPAELKRGQEMEVNRNSANQKMYEALVIELVQLIKNGNLTWKFCHIGMLFLSCLVRCDSPLPSPAVELTVQTLIHDSLTLRKVAQNIFSSVLKQLKRPHKDVNIDAYKQSGHPEGPLQPGDRADNQWHVYNTASIPDTKDKWESMVMVEKTHWGYYTWPKSLKTYAPFPEQPPLNRSEGELTENERLIYQAFTNADFVKTIIEFLSLEENKAKDKYEPKKMNLFKGLFRNYGDCVAVHIKPHIERLVKDVSHDKHEVSQRCAMEILSGIIRGSKHWSYEQTMGLWDWALPLLRSALNNLTVQTHDDWGNFFTVISESRDPRKIYWLFEMLMDNPLSGEGGSFGDAGRLYMLQNSMLQQEWRICDLVHRLVVYLTPFLSHQYKNVRDRIGSVLSNVFMLDYKMFENSCSNAPAKTAFIASVLPKLERLQEIMIEEAQHQNEGLAEGSSASLSAAVDRMEVENHHEESEEKKSLIRLCKTVLKCVSSCIGRTFDAASAEFFQLLPIICTLQSETKDEELKTDCSLALGFISQALIRDEVIPVALKAVKTTVGSPSWHARAAVLEYIQVMVFCNFFTLHSPEYRGTIRETVMHLLCDEKLEVRDMASITLSGLLQCGYLEMNKDMLEHFEKLTRTKIKKQNKTDVIPMKKIIQRHAGVLGLSAYIQAYPYHVPDWMPQILMTLSNHVNDPQPIQMTVKKTLSNFRRTHHDNWHDHKLRFTDDQLVILTDLLVSPNYYA